MFSMKDELAKLHEEANGKQEVWRVAYASRYSKDVERHYRARLIQDLEEEGIGPIGVMGENSPVDLLIAGHPCELKVARAREKDQKSEVYQALMHDPGNRHSLNGDLVIVLCVDRDDRLWPYVIPRAKVGNRRTVEITSHPTSYRGQWRQYLKNFAPFEGD